uniref:Uncharacterized protein n=1 Tax=Ditylenchus dipsaci TaxID=166011 RepID=A0A915E0J9_9BILA
MIFRRLNWTSPPKSTKMDCSNVPVAFRLCRKSCGFCATEGSPAHAVYNYKLAHNAYRLRPLRVLCGTPAPVAKSSPSVHKETAFELACPDKKSISGRVGGWHYLSHQQLIHSCIIIIHSSFQSTTKVGVY